MATPQLFDPATFSPEQAASLVNTPGQSLSATNSASTIQGAQAMNPSPNIPSYKAAPTAPFSAVEEPPPANYNAILAGVQAAQAQSSASDQAYQDAVASLGNASADEAAFADQAGVNANKKVINDLTASLNALNAEAMAEQVKLENQPILTSIATGQQAQVEKLRAIKAMSISSQIQAAQGNLSLAQDQAERALKLKYDPIKARIDALKFQVDRNYDNLSDEKKLRADALKLQYDEQKAKIQEQEAEDKQFDRIRIGAIGQNMPVALAQQAQALYDAGRVDEAYAVMSKFTGAVSLDKGGGTGTKGVTTGFSTTKIESSIREDAVSLLDSVDSGDMTLEKAYSKLRLLYSPSEVTDDALKSLLGIVKEEDVSTPTPPPIAPPSIRRVTIGKGTKTGVLGAINNIGESITDWFKGL